MTLSNTAFCALEKPISFHIYQQWLKEGYQGSMNYLAQHCELKENPQKLVPRAQSAIVVSESYLPHPQTKTHPLPSTRKALYARGEDYHHWFHEKLDQVCSALKKEFPEEEFVSFTDSSPVLERDLAYRAGLGWIGKNTCLIHKKHGSLFFIGEIYTSLKLEPLATPHPDHCGNCTRCMDECPTQAITEERKLDARKCISYLTIESRDFSPHPLQEKMNDWLFGCDICQTVCPWNEKVFGPSLIKSEQVSQKEVTDSLVEDLRWILSSSNKSLQKAFKKTPLSRAGGLGIKRNALIVISNLQIQSLKEEVSKYIEHERLGELARRCLAKFS